MTAPPRDQLGNEINEGDLVQVKLNDAHIVGKVVKVSMGGLAVPGSKQKTPSMIRIVADMTLTFDSEKGVLIPQLLKTLDPVKQEAVQKMLDEVEKPSGPTGPQLVS